MKSTKPYQLLKQLQEIHGFNINLESRTSGPGTRIWEMHIPSIGFLIQGTHAQIITAIRSYHAGYLAGRSYTKSERADLSRIINKVHKGGSPSAV